MSFCIGKLYLANMETNNYISFHIGKGLGMTDDAQKMSGAEAQEALNAARAAEDVSRKRARMPLWLNAAMAASVGAMVAVGLEDKTELLIFCFVVVFGLLNYQRKRSGVVPLVRPEGGANWLGLTGFIVVALGVYAAGVYLTDNLGYTWAPLAAGGMVAGMAFVVSLSGRS